VLSELSYRQGACQLQTELARHDASDEAAGLLERSTDTQHPEVQREARQPRGRGVVSNG
jgi:hypothetical protein